MAVASDATLTVVGKRQYGDSEKPLTFKIPTDDGNEATVRIYRGGAITLDLDGPYRFTRFHHENEAGAKTMGLHLRLVPSNTAS
jgi:hypothetical protein